MTKLIKIKGIWIEVSEQDYTEEVNDELQRVERTRKLEIWMQNKVRARQRRREHRK